MQRHLGQSSMQNILRSYILRFVYAACPLQFRPQVFNKGSKPKTEMTIAAFTFCEHFYVDRDTNILLKDSNKSKVGVPPSPHPPWQSQTRHGIKYHNTLKLPKALLTTNHQNINNSHPSFTVGNCGCSLRYAVGVRKDI